MTHAGNDGAVSSLQVQAGDPPVEETRRQRDATRAQRQGSRYSLAAQSQEDPQPPTVALHHSSETPHNHGKEQDLKGGSFLLCGLAGMRILPRLRAGRRSEGNHAGVLRLKLTALKWDETTASCLSSDPSAVGILLVPEHVPPRDTGSGSQAAFSCGAGIIPATPLLLAHT